jgi:hypothetical protein
VLRFRPASAEAIAAQAIKDERYYKRFQVSVWASAPKPGEDEDAVVQRLLAVAELTGIGLNGKQRFFVCSQAALILDAGLKFYKDEDEGEPEEHYSVDFGNPMSTKAIEAFVGAFGETRKIPT